MIFLFTFLFFVTVESQYLRCSRIYSNGTYDFPCLIYVFETSFSCIYSFSWFFLLIYAFNVLL
jgi:hypothetical protein